MKWFILSLTVLLYTSTFVSGFDFDIPSSLLEQRSKYDYDLKKFIHPSIQVEYDNRESQQHEPSKRPFHPITETRGSFLQSEDYAKTGTVRPIPPSYQSTTDSPQSEEKIDSGLFNQQNNYRATAKPEQPHSLETTTKSSGINPQLLASLAGGDFEVKYKETDSDYYDFDESDLKRPMYDLNASRQLFNEFVQKYGKTYTDKQDEETHYQYFVNSLKTINRLNEEGGSASFDINIMSDEDPDFFG